MQDSRLENQGAKKVDPSSATKETTETVKAYQSTKVYLANPNT